MIARASRISGGMKKHLCLFVLYCALGPFHLYGQTNEPSQPPPIDLDQVNSTVQSLEALENSLAAMEQTVTKTQQALIAAQDEVTRQELSEKLREAKAKYEERRRQFEEFAVDIDLRPFVEEEETTFDWQQELGKLLKPIIAELENATAESRAIGELRAEIGDIAERQELSAEAIENLDMLLSRETSPALTQRLNRRRDHWQRIESDASNRLTALNLQLENRLKQRESVLDETTGFAKNFIQTRGLNLLIAIFAFCVVFFGVRWLMALAGKMKRRKGGDKNFSSRLTILLLHLFSIIGGIGAMMLVFNMAGDWFMLGIIIIFLLGIGWASINTLPDHVETVKLMLNIGMVREDERMEFKGVPYKVDSLAFSARLVNPLLDGGVQNLPVKALVGHHSRPAGDHEEWFPTRTGDWVELSDGRIGKVSYQNPSSVQVVELGGAQVVYPTASFVELNPRNLSTGFRIQSVFGVDYRHQNEATQDIPKAMNKALTEGLKDVVDAAWIRDVEVRFQTAGSSSLDYRVNVDLDGKAASSLEIVQDTIQRILVETCNANGWTIPFPQLTIHRVDN